MQFLGAVAILANYGGVWLDGVRELFRHALVRAFEPDLGLSGYLTLSRELILRAFLPLGIAGAVLVGITLAVQLVSTGLGFSGKRLMPDFKRFNPLSKLKQLPKQNAVSLIQAIFLLGLTGAAVYKIAVDSWLEFLLLPLVNVRAGTSILWTAILSLLWKLGAMLLVFGAVDLMRTKLKYSKDLRMSKQEVKDENRENEGNPQIKAQIRRLRRNMMRKQMMADVAKATVVVTNPTHYAIAIRYDMESMASPQVVAKGRNYLALRIRQRAIDNGVPIVENPPLARALYKSVEVGQEVPGNFYRAVAEVLAYIFRMTNQMRSVHKN